MKLPDIRTANFRKHFPEEFSTAGFWQVLQKLSKRGGRKLLTSALTLYFCLRDTETPAWAKSVIIGALGYLVLPMDFIPDAILGAGFTDDWAVIIGALGSVVAHVKSDHRDKAAAMAERFLGAEGAGSEGEDGLRSGRV